MHSSVNYNKLSFVISIMGKNLSVFRQKEYNYQLSGKHIYKRRIYIYERKEENQEISSKILFI